MERGRPLQGSQDIPLNDLGRSQAAACRRHPRRSAGARRPRRSSLPFVASPLGRARSTMELVRGALNLPPARLRHRRPAARDRLRPVGRLDAARDAAARPRRFRRAPDRQMDVSRAGRRELCQRHARMRDWFDSLAGRYGHCRPWRHHAGADGRARPRDAAQAAETIGQGVVYVFSDGGMKKYG